MKKKMAIGFDLGTTSVGWSIIEINQQENKEKKLNIIDMGVRMFDDPTSKDSNVENRRLARGRRRRIWRQKIRKNDLFKLLIKYNIVKDEMEFHRFITEPIHDETTNAYFLPVEIKIKGLEHQLNKQELTLILHNYIKHRGSLNTIDEMDEDKEKEDDKRRKKLVGFYNSELLPCENQYDWYKSSGSILGNDGNYLITNEQFKKEIQIILNNQSNIGVNQAFIDEFLKLFSRHRHYSEGPGSEKSLSTYGRTELNEDGNLVWIGGNLWDKLIGKCTYYPEENRNHKKAPVTEVFNLLNNLANINLLDPESPSNKRKITNQEKQMILKLEDFTLAKILKSLGKTKKDIYSGLAKNGKEEFIIEEMKSTNKLIKWAKKYNLQPSFNLTNEKDLDLLQQIFEIGVKVQNKQERFEEFKKEVDKVSGQSIFIGLNDEALRELSELTIWKSKTSSLSKKAQKEFIKFAIEDNEGIEQMTYFNENNPRTKNSKFSKYKYFPANIFENEVMPGTVKRTFNQAIKVLNAILKSKKYQEYELSHIIIELARELNSEEEKNRITNELTSNKKYLDTMMEEHGVKQEQLKGENRLKFLLWIQQNKQDIYDGQEIKLHELLSNPTAYHVDHIIPVSISFIDSMQNKVLTKAINNAAKADKTPYQWLSAQGKYKEYKERCWKLLDNEGDKKRKSKLENKIKKYLLYEQDPFSELGGFVERQLNDTRYISKLFTNQLKLFFSSSEYWSQKNHVVINSINGSLTTYARNNIFVEETSYKKLMKNRDIYNHHAIDATIIAFLGLNSNIEKLLKYRSKNIIKKQINGQDAYVDLESGEVFANKEDFFKDISEKSKYFRDQMINYVDPEINSKTIRFSRMIVTKNNIPLSNETIYSLRKIKNLNDEEDSYFKIETINLLKDKIEKLKEYFGDDAKNAKKLLAYYEDPKLYNYLNQIWLQYYDSSNPKMNPFSNYLNSDPVKEFLNKREIKPELTNKIPVIFDLNSDDPINSWVLKLKIKSSQIKDFEEIFTLSKHNNNAFYDSLKFTGVRIYQKNDGTFKTIFLSVLNLKWDPITKRLIVDENKIKTLLEKNNISNFEKFIEIKSGIPLVKDNNLFYFVGGGHRKENKLEIKSMTMENILVSKISNWISAPNRNQWQIAVSSIARDFKLCKVDILGNIYDVQTFDEYFDKN